MTDAVAAAKFCEVVNLPCEAVGLVCRLITMLLNCGYDRRDILTVLALTSWDYSRLSGFESADWQERLHVILLQAFLAHCYVFDCCCPLRHWHRHLFSDYCESLPDLNRAVARLLTINQPRTPEALDAVRSRLLMLDADLHTLVC